MLCKICANNTTKIFNTLVLQKYQVAYYQCIACKFIQTEEPYWLSEAYSSAIGILDIGLLYRNTEFSKIVPSLLDKFSTSEDSYLDYGGGYGVFVRMMRDKGYSFYLYDKYCENLYAKYFTLDDYSNGRFKAVTAFEVFEHLENPVEEINKIWKYSDVIIFSTELQPDKVFTSDEDWWYFVPFGGQHIALYHHKTLEKISEIFGCKLYTNGINLHILTKLEFENPFIKSYEKDKVKAFLSKLIRKKAPVSRNRNSLLMDDFETYKRNLGIK